MVTLLKAKVRSLTLEDADGQRVASDNHGGADFRLLPHLPSVGSDFDRVSSVCCLRSEPPVNMILSSFLDPALHFKRMLKKAAGVCCLALAVTFSKAAEVWWSLL